MYLGDESKVSSSVQDPRCLRMLLEHRSVKICRAILVSACVSWGCVCSPKDSFETSMGHNLSGHICVSVCMCVCV